MTDEAERVGLLRLLAPYRKLIAAIIGAALQAVNLGLLSEEVNDWLTVVIAFLTVLGVYAVPNVPLALHRARDPRTGRFVRGDDRAQTYIGIVVVILLLIIILLATGRL